MNRLHRSSVRRHAQRGAALLVAMIFMIVLMLIVASSVKLTNINTKVVGNMQTQKEAEAAGQQAVEMMISSDLSTLPLTQTTTQTTQVDINDGGTAASKYNVTLNATAINCQNSGSGPGGLVAIDLSKPVDSSVTGGMNGANSGVPSNSGRTTTWNIEATVVPPNSTQTAAVITQGVTLTDSTGAAAPCP